MLVLTRKLGQAIRINGTVTVKITELKGNRVRIGIEAPKEVPVHREEVAARIQGESESAGRSVLLHSLRGIGPEPLRRSQIAG